MAMPHWPQELLCCVLRCLVNVKTVLLQVPATHDQNYNGLCVEINAKSQAGCFQHIDTLILQGDPDPAAADDDDDDEWDDDDDDDDDEWDGGGGGGGGNGSDDDNDCASVFQSFPKLTTLKISSDAGDWIHNTLPPNIRHIYLYNSSATPWHLSNLLRNAPMLETLCMTPCDANLLDEFMDDDTDDVDPQALDHALADHAERLQVLEIRWDYLMGPESLTGSDGRLTSLANMQSLRILYVQMALLYGEPSAVLEMPLINLLPPNLVELTLEDWWWADLGLFDELLDPEPQERAANYQTQRKYRASVVPAVMEFARDVRQRLRKLKKVVCMTPCWVLEKEVSVDWVPEEATSLESHLVKATFLEQGIEFSVESGVRRGEEMD